MSLGPLGIRKPGAGREQRGYRTLGDSQLQPQGAGLSHGGRRRGWEDGCLDGQEVPRVEEAADVEPEVGARRWRGQVRTSVYFNEIPTPGSQHAGPLQHSRRTPPPPGTRPSAVLTSGLGELGPARPVFLVQLDLVMPGPVLGQNQDDNRAHWGWHLAAFEAFGAWQLGLVGKPGLATSQRQV